MRHLLLNVMVATVVVTTPVAARAGGDTAGISGTQAAMIRGAASVTSDDVHAWLNTYRAAWESRDAARVRNLGVIRAEQEDALRRVFSNYTELHVSLANERITFEGTQAVVSFDRTDHDETGKPLRHPRQTVRLERRPAGLIGTRF